MSHRTETTGIPLMTKTTHYYYEVQLSKIHTGEQMYIERKLSEFYTLHDELKARAYINLPKLPGKTGRRIKDPTELEQRRLLLVRFLRDLIARRETRNAQELIEFLDLDQFAPEILIKKPTVITRWNCNFNVTAPEKKLVQYQFNVTHCVFLPAYNIFILALNTNSFDKKGKRAKISHSRLQIVSFKNLGVVADSKIRKSGTAPKIAEKATQASSAAA